MKVVYRSVTEGVLCIWVYEDDGKSLICNVAVKKEPSGLHLVNVHKTRS